MGREETGLEGTVWLEFAIGQERAGSLVPGLRDRSRDRERGR
jgi:hypothetical protein